MNRLTWLLLLALSGCEATAQLVPANDDLSEPGLETPDEAVGEVVGATDPDPTVDDCTATDTCPVDAVDATDPRNASVLGTHAPTMRAGSSKTGRSEHYGCAPTWRQLLSQKPQSTTRSWLKTR